MNFQVIPVTNSFGPIPTDTLRYAIAMKHCLYAKLDIKSTIQDSDGFVISEKEQSAFIFNLLG